MKRLAAVLVAVILAATLGAGALAADPFQVTVEGEGHYFVTGESFPTMIQVAGYNSRTRYYYLNFTLTTTKTVEASQTATFHYFVEVFDDSGYLIGNLGELALPQQVSTPEGTRSVTVRNAVVPLSSLPAAHRVVITVTEVAVQ